MGPHRVVDVDVEHLGDHRLRVTFTDGLVRELDFAEILVGVLASIDDVHAFARVFVDASARTLCWPNGIDFDPDVLHGDQDPATGPSALVTREYRLQASG